MPPRLRSSFVGGAGKRPIDSTLPVPAYNVARASGARAFIETHTCGLDGCGTPGFKQSLRGEEVLRIALHAPVRCVYKESATTALSGKHASKSARPDATSPRA